MISPVLLDTDTLSLLRRGHPQVSQRASAYIVQLGHLTFTSLNAATIYADLHQRGELIGEVDILIAGIALANGLGVVTCNSDHFRRVKGLLVEDWSQ